MGAWDTGSLDNDDAMDFISDLMNTAGDRWLMIEMALALVSETTLDTEVLDECAALAAAEVVAVAAGGSSSSGLDRELAGWVLRNEPKHLHMLSQEAIHAIDKIAAHSELHALWRKADDLERWLEGLNDLKKRLAITIH